MSKNPIDSKTIWFNLLLIVTAKYYPPIHDYFVANPDLFLYLLGLGNIFLKFISHQAVSFKVPVCLFGIVHSKNHVMEAALAIAHATKRKLVSLDEQEKINDQLPPK